MALNLSSKHSILHGINEDNAGLYHPSLITDLCKAAGVVWSKGEEIQQPKWIIYAKLIEAMEDNDEDPGAGSGSAAHAMPTQPSTMQARKAALEAQVAYFGQYHQSFVNISPTFYTTTSIGTTTTTTGTASGRSIRE
ncbi:hypothetical protein MRB53_035095 [Persea americana]|uniref:Uncharacterized protein n=1 Tax=Persea americana TaxID=3435 RepID=A0ACC2K3Y0_PERAE|nr:hypothetical protein MRB53_035095 [Persea americana]